MTPPLITVEPHGTAGVKTAPRVTQASEEAAEYMRAEAAEMENAKIQELQDAGMTVIELTEEERQTFVDAVDGVAEQFRDEMGEEAWELYQTCITEAQG